MTEDRSGPEADPWQRLSAICQVVSCEQSIRAIGVETLWTRTSLKVGGNRVRGFVRLTGAWAQLGNVIRVPWTARPGWESRQAVRRGGHEPGRRGSGVQRSFEVRERWTVEAQPGEYQDERIAIQDLGAPMMWTGRPGYAAIAKAVGALAHRPPTSGDRSGDADKCTGAGSPTTDARARSRT